MTLMVPADFRNGLMGEEAVFKCIKDAPQTNNWVCFHNLYCGEHRKQQSTEIDFLLIAPPFGVFCIEVKGGTVSYCDGVWKFSGGNKHYETQKSPFEQARLNALCVIDYLKKRVGKPPFVFNGVIFPFSDFPESAGLEAAAAHRILDRRNFSASGLYAFIKNIHGNDCPKAQMSLPEAEKVRSVLGPRFEISPSLLSLIGETESRILRYTEEQYRIVETLAQCNPRVVVSGYAGTGKTVMAMDLAMRYARNGERTGLIVISKNLAKHLQKRVAEVCQKNRWSPPEVFSLYTKEEAKKPEAFFDAIIIDEAQDIMTSEELCIIVDSMLKGGIEKGKWFFFGDTERQVLEAGANQVFYELFAVSPVRLPLKRNCRNTRYIANRALVLGRFSSDSLELPPRADTDPVVNTKEFGKEPFEKVLAGEVKQMRDDGVDKKDIVVLVTNGSSYMEKASRTATSSGIDCYSVSEFKGLEARCIIYVDPVCEVPPMYNSDLLRYVGVTRASVKLTFIIHEKDKHTLDEFYQVGAMQNV